MALPRVCSFSRSLLSRGSSTRVASSVVLSSRIVFPHRQFTSRSWLLQEALQQQPSTAPDSISSNAVSEPLRKKNARSVAVMMLPKRATRAEVEKLFKDAGLEVASILMRMDRFSYTNDRYAFVELADEQQAQKAVEILHETKTLGEQISVKPLKLDYVWDVNHAFNSFGHHVSWDNAGTSQAVQPIIDGRRLYFSVKTPGWGPKKAPIKERNLADRKVVERIFSRFGIEAISPILPNWGPLKMLPRFLCFVDFQTKEGMEDAIRALHDTDVEGRKVWLKPAEVSPWKAYLIGRIASEKLVQLQEQGLAPKEVDEGKFSKLIVEKRNSW